MENFGIYRRHEKDCPLFAQGMKSDIKKCTCPLWVHGSENGKRIRKSLKTRSVSRGLERLVRLQRESTPGEPAAPSIALDKAIAQFHEDCVARDLAPNTLRNYKAQLDPLAMFLPGASVRSITVDDVARFRTASGGSAKTARSRMVLLRMFLRFCQDRSWLKENPARKFRLPQSKELATPTLPFSEDEVNKIIEACERLKCSPYDDQRNRLRARALVLLLLYSGLRISDAVKLKRSAVDLASGKVLLRMMKTKHPLYTHLPEDALAALRTVPAESPEYFFWSRSSKLYTAINSLSSTIKAVAKLAGVADAHPHRFRDTFAVELLLKGEDIRTVQMLLGHTSVVTTEKHYAPFVPGMQRLLDQAVAGLHFGSSRAPAVVDPLGDTRRNSQANARRPLPFARRQQSA